MTPQDFVTRPEFAEAIKRLDQRIDSNVKNSDRQQRMIEALSAIRETHEARAEVGALETRATAKAVGALSAIGAAVIAVITLAFERIIIPWLLSQLGAGS